MLLQKKCPETAVSPACHTMAGTRLAGPLAQKESADHHKLMLPTVLPQIAQVKHKILLMIQLTQNEMMCKGTIQNHIYGLTLCLLCHDKSVHNYMLRAVRYLWQNGENAQMRLGW